MCAACARQAAGLRDMPLTPGALQDEAEEERRVCSEISAGRVAHRLEMHWSCGHITRPLTLDTTPDFRDRLEEEATTRLCSWCENGEPFPSPEKLAWIHEQADRCFAH